MREFKFRAWYKKEKIMLNVIGEVYSECFPYDFTKSKNLVLMQYTGLKDMNGKEIYDGDILSNDERYYIVSFYNGSFRAEYADGFEEYSLDLIDVAHCCEIVGNIYENPELLGD